MSPARRSAAADEAALREQAVQAVRRLDAQGLNRGSTGNLSLRLARDGADGMLITPTGMGADDLQPEAMVWMGFDGTVQGAWAPSSEWHFHRAAYLRRPDLRALVHTHSPAATALACLRRPLPAFHYMVAVAGGDGVPCTGYHLFGSEALSDAVADALADRNACLMANHGLVAAGATLAQALKVAIEIESLCDVYLRTLAAGAPVLLDSTQMREVAARFRRYGARRRR